MGNEKANSYWEAELPPNYDRVGIEHFIRAKYVCKSLPRNYYFSLNQFSSWFSFLCGLQSYDYIFCIHTD